MNVCIYIHTYIYTYIVTYTPLPLTTHRNIHTSMDMYVTYTRIYMCKCMSTKIHMDTNATTHTTTHTSIRITTHTSIHICRACSCVYIYVNLYKHTNT